MGWWSGEMQGSMESMDMNTWKDLLLRFGQVSCIKEHGLAGVSISKAYCLHKKGVFFSSETCRTRNVAEWKGIERHWQAL